MMRVTLLVLFILTTTFQVLGQDGQSPVVRVIIAPALSDTAKAVKAELNSQRAAGLAGAQDAYFFYGGRGFEPLWLAVSDGEWFLSAAGRSLLDVLEKADELGLDPRYYDLPAPDLAAPELAAAYELAVTSAAIRFASDNYGGRLDPRSLSSNLDMARPEMPLPEIFALLAAEDPGPLLADLAPQGEEFQALLTMLREYEEPVEVVQIADGPSIKPGMDDPRVAMLRERFSLPSGDGYPTIYDDALVEAVKAFQAESGLIADGILGTATRQALNRGNATTREQLLVNLEKWRWLPRDRGTYRVEVNIPEYRLWVRRDGDVVHETRVVVGTPKNQTPIFYDQIRHVVVNPYWNVPSSIARGEVGPQVIRDPGYLARREFELLTGDGTVLDPWSVNWASVAPGTFPFLLRQKPGALNALGRVKFLFPNKHDVYLHDTPEKSLFGRDVRAYSHGCVRVENPFDFAEALLADEPGFGRSTIEAAFGPRERWFNMEVKVPVFLTYFTVRIGEDGKARTFADIYGHDQRIAAALPGGTDL